MNGINSGSNSIFMKGAESFQDLSPKMVGFCPFLIHKDIETLVFGKKMDRASIISRIKLP